ncbi:MAG: hypothetical protein Q8N34_03200 [Gammaproteobacteria bacterium]|nr:hypothetical protein [Gammaproteobacteria bacterium]
MNILAHVRNGVIVKYFDKPAGWVVLESGQKVSPPVAGYVNGNDKILPVIDETVDTSTGVNTTSSSSVVVKDATVSNVRTIRDMTTQEIAATQAQVVADIISVKRAEIAKQYDAAIAPLEAAHSQKERDTWPQQVTEARAFQDNVNANIPLVAALRVSRGKSETAQELTTKIITNYSAFSNVVGTALGIMQARNEALAAIHLDDEDAIAQIEAV